MKQKKTSPILTDKERLEAFNVYYSCQVVDITKLLAIIDYYKSQE